MKAEVTPRPWHCNLGNGSNLRNDATLWGDNGAVDIGQIGDSNRDHWTQTDVANAALIVRAVNSYDALRAVADAARPLLEAGERGLWGAWADNTPNGQVLKSMRDALAALKTGEGEAQ